MADARAGGAYLELSIKSKINKGLANAEKRLRAFGKSAVLIGGGAIGSALATLTGPVLAASNMEEVMGKFGTVFGANAESVKAWSDNLASAVGRSQRQMAEFVSNAQDLFIPLGFDEKTATEVSKQVTGLAVDLASFNNMTDGDAFRDLQAALTGSGEVMKKYGVVMSEAAVQQELMQQGIDPKGATEQQKVQARLNIIMRGTTAAQGDAIRTSGSFANQMKRLRANFEDTAVAIGNIFLPIATRVATVINTVIGSVSGWITNNKAASAMIAILAGGTLAAGAAIVSVGAAALAAGVLLSGLMSIVSAGAAVVGFFVTPLGLVVGAFVVAGAAAWHFRDQLSGVFASVGEFFGPIVQFAKDTIKGLANALMAGNLAAAGGVAMTSLEVVWLAGTNRIRHVWAYFTEGLLTVWDTVSHALMTGVRSTMQFISHMIAGAVDGIKTLLVAVAQYDPTGLATKTADALAGFDFRGGAELIAREQAAADKAAAGKRLQRARATSASISATDKALEDARERRAALLAQAEAENKDGLSFAAIKARIAEVTGINLDFTPPVPTSDSAGETDTGTGAIRKSTALGSFSALGASLLASGSTAQDETAKNTRALVEFEKKKDARRDNAADVADVTKLVFGP